MKIRYKLLLSVLVPVLIIFFSLIYLSYVSSKKAILVELEKSTVGLLNLNITELDGKIESLEDVAQDLATTIETLKPNSEDDIKNVIQAFLARSPDVYGVAVSFEPHQFGDGTKSVAPYYHRGPSGLVYVDLADPGYNYTKWDWYRTPIDSGKPSWSEPYIDVGGGNIAMTTYSFPFYKDGKVWGVTTVDVSLQKLTKIIEDIKPGKDGMAFLLSQKGVFISMKRGSWELKRTIFDAAKEFSSVDLTKLGEDMIAGKTDFSPLVNPLTDKLSWFGFGPIRSTGWSLAIVLPQEELLAQLTTLHHYMIFLSIAGAFAIFGILFLVAKKISNPIIALTEGARRIASGDFSVKLKTSKSRDEIGLLTMLFNDMKTSLSATMGQLGEEKEMFRVAFKGMTDGLVIANSSWLVLQHNSAAENLLNLPAEASLIEHLEARFESNLPLSQLTNKCNENCEFKLTRRESGDFRCLTVACTITPIYDENGRLKERVLSARDTSEFESEEVAKRNFLSLMSHKLLTPLTVLKGKMMLFKDGLLGEVNEKQAKNLDSMVGQTGKLDDLISNLVNFVTIEESNLDLSKEDIELAPFINEIAREQELWFTDKHAKVVVRADDISKIVFNRKYLHLILAQLIDNGLKFNMSDPAEVTVECKKVDHSAVIVVADNGIGIPSEYTDKIFEKFYQIDKYFTGNVEGAGLGLTYVRKIIESFGGMIGVRSEPGKGSVFTVTLPGTLS